MRQISVLIAMLVPRSLRSEQFKQRVGQDNTLDGSPAFIGEESYRQLGIIDVVEGIDYIGRCPSLTVAFINSSMAIAPVLNSRHLLRNRLDGDVACLSQRRRCSVRWRENGC